jgi:hypothetical protein
MDMKIPFHAPQAVPTHRARRNAERDQQIRIRYLAGETLASIGASFGVSAERVRKVVKRFGLDKSNAGLAVRNRDKPRSPDVEPFSSRVYGCSPAELMQFTHEQRQSFLQQRTNVRRSDTLWLLSLPQWVAFWTRSGKWAERGRGPSKYGLSRIDPAGSFSAENVQVVSNYQSTMWGRKRKSAARMRGAPGKSRSHDWIREMTRILEKSPAREHRADTSK